jgi:oxygen-independent coproporphyrinogen-3 oxidase
MRSISLYLHVPFCARNCPYCSFYHVAHSPEQEAEYVDAACEEIRRIPNELGSEVSLRTVYFGGGTPSVLSDQSLARIRSALDAYISEGRLLEFTMELNPEDVNETLLGRLVDMDVNRISLGTQSMDTRAQKKLQRCSLKTNRRAVALLRSYFDNISFDVLAGIPLRGYGCTELKETMHTLQAYHPKHFSVYCLEYHEGESPGSLEFFNGVDAEKSADEYLLGCDYLKEQGYHHYEVSNFAVPGFESLHNLAYWCGDEYVGIGPGAHSFMNGRRYYNEPSLERYLSSAADGRQRARIYDDEKSDHLLEKLMLALRTDRGIPVEWIHSSHGVVAELVDQGLATVSGGNMILNERGFLLLDEIIVRIAEECENEQEGRRSLGRGLDSRFYYG